MAQQREARFINEWLRLNFPTALQWKRVRIGPLAEKKFGRLLAITLRWADAVVFDGERVHLIEAKLKSDLGVISQLKEYKRLLPETAEFTMLRDKPIVMHLLLPFEWRDLVEAAVREGIQVDIFKPEWLYREMGWALPVEKT